MARGTAIVADVAQYVEDHRGSLITIEELQRALPPEVQASSIQRVMLDLVRREIGLEVINQGRVWRLQPQGGVSSTARVIGTDDMRQVVRSLREPAPVKVAPVVAPAAPSEDAVFEFVGQTKDGGIVLRDESGTLWSANRM